MDEIMSITVPDSLCPIYKGALAKMHASLESAETDDEKTKIFIKFSDQYLMIPEYWKILIDIYEKKYGFFRKPTGNMIKKGRSHFYSLDDWQQAPMYFITEYHIKWSYLNPFLMGVEQPIPEDYCNIISGLKELITFPHKNLKTVFDMLKMSGLSPITHAMKEKYEKSTKQYQKFIEAGENDEKWLECLKELEVNKAVIDNIELRLGQGQHYANQRIWKYYINFLKSKSSSTLFNVYDRYCRLFISDSRTREEYLELKNGKHFLSEEVYEGVPKRTKQWETVVYPIYFKDSTKSLNQSMAFRSPLIHYITKSAKAPILHKLHKTCKYFFIQSPYRVVHRLFLSDRRFPENISLCYSEQSLFIEPDAFHASSLQNLYISQDLVIVGDKAQKSFSSRFHKCEASKIEIKESKIDEKDFKIFINSGAVNYINVQNSTIIKENGDFMGKEEARELLELYGNQAERFLFW